MANAFLLTSSILLLVVLSHAVVFSSIMVTKFTEWRSVTACTSEGVSTTDIDCKSDVIQIGHGHYGVKADQRSANNNKNKQSRKGNAENAINKFRCRPDFEDCIMDYTSKLSDRCNGLSKCSMSLLKQFIHKCKEPASYIYLTYRCVRIPPQSNICKSTEYRSKEAHLISPLFPYDYPKNVDCTCIINRPEKTVLTTEAVSYQILPPDVVTVQTENSKKMLLYASNASTLIKTVGSTVFRFQSDSSLSRSGFWMKLNAYPTCSAEWDAVDNKCVRLIQHKLPWEFARQKCRNIGGHLLTIKDHVRRSRIHNLIVKSGIDSQKESFWLGLSQKGDALVWDDGTNDSWKADIFWPWDRSKSPSHDHACANTMDNRWDMDDCSLPKYFICEQDLSRVRQEMLLTCGQSSNLVKASAYAMRTRLLPDNDKDDNRFAAYDDIERDELDEDMLTNKRAIVSEQRLRAGRLSHPQYSDTFKLCLVLTFMILLLITLIVCNVVLIYICQKRLKKAAQLPDFCEFTDDPLPMTTILKLWPCVPKKYSKRKAERCKQLVDHPCSISYNTLAQQQRNLIYPTICCHCERRKLYGSNSFRTDYEVPVSITSIHPSR